MEQSKCDHSRITTFVYDDGNPASLWACHDCKKKFVPLDLEQEKDATRWRKLENWGYMPDELREALETWDFSRIKPMIDAWEGK